MMEPQKTTKRRKDLNADDWTIESPSVMMVWTSNLGADSIEWNIDTEFLFEF